LLRHGYNSIKQAVGNEEEIYEQILADFEILNPDTRPEGDEKDLRYGEENIKNMCSRFRLENVRSILNGFREYCDEGGKKYTCHLSSFIKYSEHITVQHN
jgi:hypothetical protein